MVGISSIFPTISGAWDQKSWTWYEVASGHLDGNQAARAFTKESHKTKMVTLEKWAKNIFYSYSLYNQAGSLGLFDKHPSLVTPIKCVVVAVAAVNLYAVAFDDPSGFALESFEVNRLLLWRLTPKIHAVGAIVATVFGFQKHPMQAVAFFTAGAVTLMDNGMHLLTKKISWLWKKTSWCSRANLFWNGDWPSRGLIAIQMCMKL